jgi:hypothetical protein
LKKRTKKLLFLCSLRVAQAVSQALSQCKKSFFLWRLRVALPVPQALSQSKKVFLLLFVHKKKCFLSYAFLPKAEPTSPHPPRRRNIYPRLV